jgi:excisionase family DNA binding protein
MYSPDQVADMLGLHVRTVRGYVRDGRLPAVRIGKQYRISEQDLRAFTGEPLAEPPVRAEATAVVQLTGIGRELMDRVSTLVVAGANSTSAGGQRLHVHTAYDASQRSLKVIAVGEPDDAARVLSMIGALVQDAAT